MSSRFTRFTSPFGNKSADTSAEEKTPYAPTPMTAPAPVEHPAPSVQEVPPSVFVPEIEFKPVNTPTVNPSDDGALHNNEQSTGFYGSYGAVCNTATTTPGTDTTSSSTSDDYMQQEFKPVFSTDTPAQNNSEYSWSLPNSESEYTSSFNPVITSNDDDELVLPDSVRFGSNTEAAERKSIGYEDTVKIAHAATANKKQPINQSITDGIKDMVKAPKIVEVTAVASGTVTSKNELPPLKEGQMYVGITHKQLRRLRSRSFRGLGILCTLCLVIISSFCIWSYVNSFADPLVGRWKGNVESQDLPIEAVQQLGTDKFDSTWEFSDGGSMYLNLLINNTPVSLGGTYEKKNDEKGEQYLAISLTNPMDGADYTFEMYYTVTGKALVLNDMQGLGMSIDLVKE